MGIPRGTLCEFLNLKRIFLTCCVIVFVLCLIGLGIAEIVLGARHLHDCNIEKMVPIYLIVGACAPILFGGLAIRGEDNEGITGCSICGIIGGLFNLTWLICGSVWVYPNYSTVHNDTYVPCQSVNDTRTPPGCTEGTCNDTLLSFAFVMVTLNWIFMAIWIGLMGYTVWRMCYKKTYAGLPLKPRMCSNGK